MTITLFDLAGADAELRFSPYCWRIKFALAHKGLSVTTVPWRFSDKAALAFASHDRVPVIRDGDHAVGDSWAIAQYLDAQYPAGPTLFGGPGGVAHARFINAWADSIVVPAIARLIIRDLWDVVAPQDRDYFRQSREARFGMTLEQTQARREERLPAFRDLLVPVRLTLRGQPWLGGVEPSYADYIVAGTLMWPRCGSRFELLEAGDPVATWFDRVLDLYGGLGRRAMRVA